MEMDPIRERLRCIAQFVAEIQALLPDAKPHLTLLPDDPVFDLPSKTTSSSARGDVAILWNYPQVFLGFLQTGSEAEPSEAAEFYSEEEIRKMPKLKDGRFRKTSDGYWQVRYRREGKCVQFTNKYKKVVMQRFKEWLKQEEAEKKVNFPKKATTFSEFSELFFENVKKVQVDAKTCDTMRRQCKRHILPVIGDMKLRQIAPMDCHNVLTPILERGHGRTAEAVSQLLNEILNAALGEKLLQENPMKFVKIPKHERKCGVALSREELKQLQAACRGTRYEKPIMLMLCTGIRRGEFKTLVIDADFVTVENGKRRKGQRVKKRRIPISAELRAFLPLSAEDLAVTGDTLTRFFKKVCPDHTLKDLRHTFTTVCLESTIPKELVDVWTAHVKKGDMTTAVYTHFSDAFMLAEIKKLNFFA